VREIFSFNSLLQVSCAVPNYIAAARTTHDHTWYKKQVAWINLVSAGWSTSCTRRRVRARSKVGEFRRIKVETLAVPRRGRLLRLSILELEAYLELEIFAGSREVTMMDGTRNKLRNSPQIRRRILRLTEEKDAHFLRKYAVNEARKWTFVLSLLRHIHKFLYYTWQFRITVPIVSPVISVHAAKHSLNLYRILACFIQRLSVLAPRATYYINLR